MWDSPGRKKSVSYARVLCCSAGMRMGDCRAYCGLGDALSSVTISRAVRRGEPEEAAQHIHPPPSRALLDSGPLTPARRPERGSVDVDRTECGRGRASPARHVAAQGHGHATPAALAPDVAGTDPRLAAATTCLEHDGDDTQHVAQWHRPAPMAAHPAPTAAQQGNTQNRCARRRRGGVASQKKGKREREMETEEAATHPKPLIFTSLASHPLSPNTLSVVAPVKSSLSTLHSEAGFMRSTSCNPKTLRRAPGRGVQKKAWRLREGEVRAGAAAGAIARRRIAGGREDEREEGTRARVLHAKPRLVKRGAQRGLRLAAELLAHVLDRMLLVQRGQAIRVRRPIGVIRAREGVLRKRLRDAGAGDEDRGALRPIAPEEACSGARRSRCIVIICAGRGRQVRCAELALLVLAVGRTGDVDERGRAGLMTPFCSGGTLKLRTLAGGENGLFTTLVGGVPMLGKGGRGCAA
ncbi:hypothetical protein C8J57DRAFT_1476233 [Mycena rebaudengoi]|nr:hypothetical protein C8J57DRAFT_1476233 [Mycena rebaudengoi]